MQIQKNPTERVHPWRICMILDPFQFHNKSYEISLIDKNITYTRKRIQFDNIGVHSSLSWTG